MPTGIGDVLAIMKSMVESPTLIIQGKLFLPLVILNMLLINSNDLGKLF